MIPVQAKLIAATGIVVVSFVMGFKASSHFSDVTAAKIEAVRAKELSAAKDRALAAEMIARSAESRANSSIAHVTTTFEQVRENEKAATDRIITDLRNAVVRLRVSTQKPAARTPGLSSTATCPSSSDDQAEATISGSVAARLAGRYADYNALVGQLELCQATLEIDRQMTNAR